MYKPLELQQQPKSLMNNLNFWFGMLLLIGPIHMYEQLVVGLDELFELKSLVANYYAKFADPDVGTWLLVVITATMIQLLLYGMLAGGRWRLFCAGFFGVFAITELHHLVRTVANGSYNPGLATAFLFAGIGVMILRAVVAEWREMDQAMGEGRV